MSIVLKLTAKRGKSPRRGIDHYWSVIMGRELQDMTFTVSEILAASDASRADVRDFVKRLHLAGLIEHTHTRETGELVYKAKVRQSATPRIRRDGTVIESVSKQKCIWNAMRSSVCELGFTALDIVAFGKTDETVPTKAAILSYLQMLARAGYLIMIDKGGPGRLARWRLDPAMNTGPLPPMILKTKVVFDQNRHAIVGDDVEAEEVKL